ncbi:MAG: hypothetical protein V1866_04500 [archaeon]
MMLLVMCPKCGNRQKTNPKVVLGSVKRCVYCGHSFVIHSSQKDRIVKQVVEKKPFTLSSTFSSTAPK